MNMRRCTGVFWFLLLLSLSVTQTQAATTRTWDGPAGGDWFDAANWDAEDSSENYPQAGDTVKINTGSVLLTNQTEEISSFTITNATLVFSNWTTRLRAETVEIGSDGVLTLPDAFTEAEMSNRVWIVCQDFTLGTGSVIQADARGFFRAEGPGKGENGNGGGGGGHGGIGARGDKGTGGVSYGSLSEPTAPGSGGGKYTTYVGGNGGGAVRIDATGAVIINGTISANGGNGGDINGGGAGGSIYISSTTFTGTNGVIRANGGEGRDIRGGAGSGGRIAVHYQSLTGDPDVVFSADHGIATRTTVIDPYDENGLGFARMGTLWFSDTALLDQKVSDAGGTLSDINGYIAFGSTNIWKPVGLTHISDVSIGLLTDTGLHLTNDLLVTDAAVVVNTNAALLQFDGALSMTNASTLTVYSGMADTYSGINFGNEISIDGAFTLYSNSWYVPVSHPTNGGSVRLQSASLTIVEGGGVNANMAGFRSYVNIAHGPGAGVTSGDRGGGGGYGGAGGRGNNANAHGGGVYGETNRPLHPGSAGGWGYTTAPGYGHGGGYVRIDTGPMVLDGTITANGKNGQTVYGGGGSGGGVFILCDSLEGRASGLISVEGGDGGGQGGGGGGGRVAVSIGMSSADRATLIAGDEVDDLSVFSSHGPFLGTIIVTNGITPNGYTPLPEPGTVVFLTVSAGGTYSLVVEGDPGNYGSPQPLNYGTTTGIAADSIITNSVVTPANEANGLRRACIGWRLTDESEALIAEDVTPQAVFTLSTNRILTWNWTNEYELVVEAGPNGSVNSGTVDGWYTNQVEASSITATANGSFSFLRWIGDVPLADATNNPLTLVMDQPRTIQAEFVSISGEAKEWNGTGTWSDYNNWDPAGAPGPNDAVTIASGDLLLSESHTVKSATISSGATVTFTNWTTALIATEDITIAGTVTLPPPFAYPSAMSNRVWMVCRDLTVEEGGLINAAVKGYFTHTGPGKGGGNSSNHGSGGGHGGVGGASDTTVGGPIYGITNAPLTPGSGGGGTWDSLAGHGGGVVFIDASRDVVVDGTITANGGNGGNYNGGGAGGSIFIIAGNTFTGGATGIVCANGGDRGSSFTTLGGGGGGRVAIWHRAGAMGSGDREILIQGGTVDRLQITETLPTYLGIATANAAESSNDPPGNGTVVFLRQTPPPGSIFMVR